MKYRFLVATLLSASLTSPSPAADDEKGLLRPAVTHAAKFLFNKLVVDECWDKVTGKPDVKKMDQRLRQLEESVALRSELQDEIQKLRKQVNERVTRDEFRRMVDRTATQLRTIQERLDEHDEEIEKLKVLQEDLKNKADNSTSAEYFRRRGMTYEADNQPYKAVACYNIAVRLAPSDPVMYRQRCSFYVKTGAAGVGVADATEAIRLDPKSGVAFYHRGLGHLADGSYNEAVEDFSKARSLGAPDAHLIYAARATARFQMSEYKLAISDCNVSIDTSPNPLAYRTRALVYVAQKEFDKAVADAAEAIRLEPKNAENYCARAEARVNQGKLPTWEPNEFRGLLAVQDPAEDDAKEAVRLAPKSARAYYLLGLAHARQHNYDLAVKSYTEAIKLDPLSAVAYNARAKTCILNDGGKTVRRPDDLTKAIEDATEAIRLDPKFVDAYCTRGEALPYRGSQTRPGPFDPNKKAMEEASQLDLERAVIDLSIAIRMDPKCATAYDKRCTAYIYRQKPGDKERAEVDYKEYKRLSEKP